MIAADLAGNIKVWKYPGYKQVWSFDTYHQFRRNSDKSEEDTAERPVETKEGERDSTEEL